MQTLDDYSFGEEELLVKLSLNLDTQKLLEKQNFSSIEVAKLKKVLSRRMKGEPLNKIFKRQNFFGTDFFINNFVLAPRPETEILTEMACNSITSANENVLDLCCGSGCIGLTIAKNSKFKVNVVLSDISPKALSVARKNTRQMSLKNIKILKSDLFSRLKSDEKFDIITCNPPYIKTKDLKTLSKSVVNFDPLIALDGGEDGMKFYQKIAEEVGNFLAPNGLLFLEIGFDERLQTTKIFESQGFLVSCFKDYAGNDRVLKIKVKQK